MQDIPCTKPSLAANLVSTLELHLHHLQSHLDDARAMVADVPPEARPLLLPSVGTGLFMDALERADFDPFTPHLVKGGFSPLWHQLAVKWRLLRRKY